MLEEGWMGASIKPYEEKLKVSTPMTQRFTEQLEQQTSDADELIASETVVVERGSPTRRSGGVRLAHPYRCK